ncbi:hypothetical protein D3C86_1695560 [compost metagenome]
MQPSRIGYGLKPAGNAEPLQNQRSIQAGRGQSCINSPLLQGIQQLRDPRQQVFRRYTFDHLLVVIVLLLCQPKPLCLR